MTAILDNAAAIGFDGVELRGASGDHIGHDESPAACATIRQRFAAAGLEAARIMGYSNFVADDPAQIDQAVENMTAMVGVAAAIGCPTLRIFAGDNPGIDRAELISRAAAGIRRVAPRAEAAGVRLALETHDAWCKGANLGALFEAVDSPALGLCWDVCNSFFAEPLEETYQAVKGRIAHVHFKDGASKPDGGEYSVLPGTGEVDLKKALTLIRDDGYTGWLSFEWEKKWQPELAEPEVALPVFYAYTTALMQELGIPRG